MIKANQHAVAEVLGDGFIHEIPPYQRPYAWTSVEALQLLEDLEQALGASPAEPYFLGSIVLIRPPQADRGQVVDGQQRLTTLTILAAVLRDVASAPQERDALAEAVYIEPNPFKNQTEAVRLHAHAEDADFFREAIQRPGATARAEPTQPWRNAAQEHMWGAAQALRRHVLALSEEVRQKLVAFLLNQCVLVVVTTESRTSALRIFSVLNDRGLDLSNADVIKADLLEKIADPAEQARRARQWRELEDELGRDSFEALLEHLRFIGAGATTTRTLSEAYTEGFRKATAEQVGKFFDTRLRPAADWQVEILHGTGEAFEGRLQGEALEALAGLRLAPHRSWMPVALEVALRFGRTQRTVEFFSQLEALAWVMELGRRAWAHRLKRYAGVLAAFKEHKGDEAALAAALAVALKPTRAEQSAAWEALDGPLYGRLPNRAVRGVLERLDRLLAEQPILWNGLVTVEHILPQTPAAGDWSEFSPEDREAWTHRLGNLVLLTSGKNTIASNHPYRRKCEVYFGLGKSGGKRATYASVQELSRIDHWTPAALKARHDRHAALLAARWRIAPAAAAVRSAA